MALLPSGWIDWFTVHGEVRAGSGAAISALWSSPDHLDVFMTGTDGAVWTTFWNADGGWHAWSLIHPEIKLQPATTVTAVGSRNGTHLDLFATGTDGAVWTTFWNANAGWHAWFLIHPEIRMRPGATVTAVWKQDGEHLDLFVTGTDGAVWTTFWNASSGWQGWFLIHPEIKMQPGTTVTAVWKEPAVHLDLFAIGTDGAVWTTFWNTLTGWQPWFLIHPEIKMRPGATVTAVWKQDGEHLDLFVTGTDGAVWTTFWNASGGWQGWFLIHPEIKMQPGTTVTAVWKERAVHLDLFATGTDGAVWTTFWNTLTGWQPWFLIHPEIKMRPGATVTAVWKAAGVHLDLFATGTDGAVWTTFWFEGASPYWGLLANERFRRHTMKGVYFFAGNWKSPANPTQFYEFPSGPNDWGYSRHPVDARHLGWSESPTTHKKCTGPCPNQDFALDEMVKSGVNVVVMSYWGARGTDMWAYWAPMQTSTFAHDELFRTAVDKPLLIMPAIESGDSTKGCRGGISNAYHFSADFPGTLVDPAPALVEQIVDLVQRYLLQPADPRWPDKWATMYDRQGTERYAINLIHVASNRLAPGQHAPFAQGFTAVADRVWAQTHRRVGFTLDILAAAPAVNLAPPIRDSNGDCVADPAGVVGGSYMAWPPAGAGPALRECDAVLAIQGFIPEFILDPNRTSTAAYLQFKRDYLSGWMDQGLPVIVDVSPGYDGRQIFNSSDRPRGFTQEWRDGHARLRTARSKGIVFNTWNGYTEGFVAVPTLEDRDVNYTWLAELFR